MNDIFTVPERICFYHCDSRQNLSLRTYLEWSGEMGNLHLESRGITWQGMLAERQAFLLSRLAFRRFRPARYGMECRFQTWEGGVKGPSFLRNFQLLGPEGEVLAQSATTWMLVDPVDRRILRPSQCVHEMRPCDRPVEPLIGRLRLSSLPQVAEHVVHPSQIDGNGHMGNQYYADLLSDYAPEDLRGRTVLAAQLAFHHEARLGETVTLFAAPDGADAFSMSGRLPDGRTCFEAQVQVAL